MKNTLWFGTQERTEYLKRTENIPAWKRLLLCYFNYTTWKKARAYSKVAIDLIESNDELADEFVLRSDKLWAEVFDLPEPK